MSCNPCTDPSCPCHVAPIGMRNTTHHAAQEARIREQQNDARPCSKYATKPTNPKDAIGIRKVPASTVPAPVIAEISLGLLEGACKYGRHNYRVASLGVRASVYYDATMRHLWAWWEGEDVDPDSRLSHVTKALASLTVLRDAMIRRNWTDDRPPRTKPGWVAELNTKAAEILNRYPDKAQAYTETVEVVVQGPTDGLAEPPEGWEWHESKDLVEPCHELRQKGAQGRYVIVYRKDDYWLHSYGGPRFQTLAEASADAIKWVES